MEKLYRLMDVEEIVAEMDMSEVADDVVETDEQYQLVISGWYVYIPTLNMRLHEGIVCNWDEQAKMFMPDFSVTVLFEGEENEERYIYYEQDGMVITLANWLNGVMSMDEIEQLKCKIVIK